MVIAGNRRSEDGGDSSDIWVAMLTVAIKGGLP